MGMAALIADPRFTDNVKRCNNADALDAMIADWFRQRNLAEIMAIFEAANVVAGPVLDIRDIFKDPQYQARGNIVEVADPDFGSVKMQGAIPFFSRSPGKVRFPGGPLGAHNDEICKGELGLTAAELADLSERNVI